MYPTLEEVEKATHRQLASWSRYLPSPGAAFIGSDNFSEKLDEEKLILDRILERFNELGGWNPQLSKELSE